MSVPHPSLKQQKQVKWRRKLDFQTGKSEKPTPQATGLTFYEAFSISSNLIRQQSHLLQLTRNLRVNAITEHTLTLSHSHTPQHTYVCVKELSHSLHVFCKSIGMSPSTVGGYMSALQTVNLTAQPSPSFGCINTCVGFELNLSWLLT